MFYEMTHPCWSKRVIAQDLVDSLTVDRNSILKDDFTCSF